MRTPSPRPDLVAKHIEENPLFLPRTAVRETMSSRVLASKNVRILLKERYPKVRFSITTETYSNGSTLTVSWLQVPGAPGSHEVGNLLLPFRYGTFDGQTDDFNYDNDPDRQAFRDAFGSVKHTSPQCRPMTPEERAQMESRALASALSAAKTGAAKRPRL